MRGDSDTILLGPFCLDLAASRVLRDGVEVELRPMVFHVLCALAQNAGKYLDYEAMIRSAWNGTLVSRHTVAVTVSEAKKALGACGAWISYRPKFGYRLDIPPSEDLVKTGWHFLNRRTREGIEKALRCFEAAERENSTDPRVWQGISQCYLLLGSYAMRPPREVYPRFLAAHDRAVQVEGLTPALRSDRAHALHMFERKYTEAVEELRQAYGESAMPPAAAVRLAMAYTAMNRTGEALAVLEKAYAADPLAPGLPATEVAVRFFRREYARAVECGRKAVELHPYVQLGRFYFALALEYAGHSSEALEQYRLAQVMSPDLPWLRVLEGRYLARAGKTRQAAAIAGEMRALRASEYVEPYYMAQLYDALGQRKEAFQELELAFAENSTVLPILEVDPRMDGLRDDPRFAGLRNRLYGWISTAVAR
jgi:tetratricopeptide (TPR) repeat protein